MHHHRSRLIEITLIKLYCIGAMITLYFNLLERKLIKTIKLNHFIIIANYKIYDLSFFLFDSSLTLDEKDGS
jgi:hypothetical protein